MLRRASIALLFFTIACGPAHRGDDGTVTGGDAGPADAPCITSISGKVFAPNGTLPLNNVVVYVPENPPVAFPEGVQCSRCSTDLPGGAISRAVTGPDGSFKLEGVPPGENVPVIITTGKWRRRLTVPFVGQCVDLPIQDGTFRLPKNRSEGELPRIATTTGGFDSLACILSKIGIDASEFGDSSTGPQRVIFYNGQGGVAPGSPMNATALWGSLEEMMKYDMIINSCEGQEIKTNKTSPDLLRQYADMGGRVFGSHYHYVWTRDLIPEWQSTAVWTTSSHSGASPDNIDTTHPEGMTFATWLQNVGASTVFGKINLNDTITNASAVNPPSTRWLYSSSATQQPYYLSFKTPVGTPEDMQCGKVVYAGMHINQATSTVDSSFPARCSAGLTPDEKALIYLLFDLGACNDIIL